MGGESVTLGIWVSTVLYIIVSIYWCPHWVLGVTAIMLAVRSCACAFLGELIAGRCVGADKKK